MAGMVDKEYGNIGNRVVTGNEEVVKVSSRRRKGGKCKEFFCSKPLFATSLSSVGMQQVSSLVSEQEEELISPFSRLQCIPDYSARSKKTGYGCYCNIKPNAVPGNPVSRPAETANISGAEGLSARCNPDGKAIEKPCYPEQGKRKDY